MTDTPDTTPDDGPKQPTQPDYATALAAVDDLMMYVVIRTPKNPRQPVQVDVNIRKNKIDGDQAAAILRQIADEVDKLANPGG